MHRSLLFVEHRLFGSFIAYMDEFSLGSRPGGQNLGNTIGQYRVGCAEIESSGQNFVDFIESIQ